MRGLGPTAEAAKRSGPGLLSAAKAVFSPNEQLRQLAAVYRVACTRDGDVDPDRERAALDLLEEHAVKLQLPLSPEEVRSIFAEWGKGAALEQGAYHTFFTSSESAIALLADCGRIVGSDGEISEAEETWLRELAERAHLSATQTQAVLAFCRRRVTASHTQVPRAPYDGAPEPDKPK